MPPRLIDGGSTCGRSRFANSQITIWAAANDEAKRRLARRLYDTWRDDYVKSISDLPVTDLVEHSIQLKDGAYPYGLRQIRYSHRDVEFAERVFPAIWMM